MENHPIAAKAAAFIRHHRRDLGILGQFRDILGPFLAVGVAFGGPEQTRVGSGI
jgi:hypothetical protein